MALYMFGAAQTAKNVPPTVIRHGCIAFLKSMHLHSSSPLVHARSSKKSKPFHRPRKASRRPSARPMMIVRQLGPSMLFYLQCRPNVTARLKSQTSCNKGMQALLVRFDGLSSGEDMRTANPNPCPEEQGFVGEMVWREKTSGR